MPRLAHHSAVEFTLPLFRRKRRRSNTIFSSSAGLQSFSIVGRRYSAGSYRRLSPFFSDRFERRKMVYAGADINNPAQTQATNGSGYWQSHGSADWEPTLSVANGQPISQTDALNNTTSYTYNSLGNVLTVTDAENNVTSYTYNLLGQMTSLTDPEGNATSWTYDSMGRVVSETNEKNAARYYQYDDLDRLIQTTDRNGRIIQYEYDYLGRQTAEKWLDSNNAVIGSIEYTFDGNNNLLTVTDSISGVNYEYRYDALNRCVYTKVDSDGLNAPVEFTYSYNTSDLTVTETLIGLINGVVAPYYQNVYQYDVFGCLESISQTGTGLTAKSVEYFYNKLGQRTGATYQQNGDTVSSSDWDYDFAGKISSIQHKTASDAVFAEYGFTWDAGNNITEFETVDGTVDYTSDKTGQITGADYSNTDIPDESYSFDNNGNRTNTGYVTGDNNETLSDGVYWFSYDAEGNRTEKFLWNDTNNDGIIDASEKTLVQTFEWDYRNRLSSVTNYENGIAKEVINYLYDYLNQMVGRSVTDLTTQGQTSEFYINSNGQIVLEFDTSSVIDVVKSINLWGSNIDELVAVEQIAQNINDSNRILWTYGDHLNSIRDIAQYNTTTKELEIVNHLIYNAFGVLVSSTDGKSTPVSISPILNYRYTGKFFDDSTGLQNNINRWYDNTIGKWLSVDPIGFKGRDANLYRYAGNVTNFLDYNGLFTREEWEQVARMSDFEFRMFCIRHPLDPDIHYLRVYYYSEIYPRNKNEYIKAVWEKRFSENLFDKPYWFNDEILEIERERFGIHELFLNNSFNDSSYLVNSPISQLRNLQFDTPYTPLVVNPYIESLVNQLNNYPSNNTGGNSPHSINDFNGSNNFAQQKYMAKVSPFNINMTQISIPSNLFTKGFKETVYDENYLKPGYMSYWIQSKYEIEPNISIFDKSYSTKRFNSDFKYINNSYVSSLEVQDFSMKPILGTNLGWESNMECQYGNMHIKTNVRMIYSPIISPFGIGKFYYGGQYENWSFTGTVYVSF